MSVHHSARVRLQKEDKIQPLAVDQVAQEVPRFATPPLLHLWRIDEAEPHCSLDFGAALRGWNSSQKPVAIKHPEDGHANGLGSRFFRRKEQLSPSDANARSTRR
jgi:hypothetical protein